LVKRGFEATQVLPRIGFVVDVDNHYFMQIAKLRALRLLWWQIGRLYDESLNLVDVFIHARTTNAVPPENEPYQNLISNTTQAMSAIIGGCDALTVAGGLADEKVEQSEIPPSAANTILAQRIARNVSAILKEESYFDKVTDMGAGSYLIENLTHQLAKAVWESLFNRTYAK
jgi:methylmalonyl-CoA mutase